MAADSMRAIVWKNLPINGTEFCALWLTDGGWLVKRSVVGVLERPTLASYEVLCDENWLTSRIPVERTIEARTQRRSA
jgi:hypothetical protein